MTVHHRRIRFASCLVPAALVVAGACTAGLSAPAGSPVPNPGVAAAEVVRSTTPGSPRQATFGWTLDEAGTRLRGRGVARFEAPGRIRLDLFGPRGETYLAAALVDDTFRVPPGAEGRIALPSPTLLWGALGVAHPPADARLSSATETDEARVLRYEAPDGQVFEFRASRSPGPTRLARLERLGDAGVLESIRLEYEASGALGEARYRDLTAYRELVLDFEEIVDVESFPADIWSPPGANR